jgi:hypothetical protein
MLMGFMQVCNAGDSLLNFVPVDHRAYTGAPIQANLIDRGQLACPI